MYLNKALIYGNLTRDPELKALPNGGKVAEFGVATNRVFKDRDGTNQEEVEFHNVVCFGKQAEVVGQYLKKGRGVFIEGRIRTRNWEAKDGSGKRYRTEIVVDRFQFGPRPPGEGSGGAWQGRKKTTSPESQEPKDSGEAIQYPEEDIKPEDIPF